MILIRLRRAGFAMFGALLSAGLAPAAASAHGVVGRADLPVPEWLFAWAASLTLLVSFVALGALWTHPRLEHVRERRLCGISWWVTGLGGAAGVFVFIVAVDAGLHGSQLATANITPTLVWVVLWVVLALLSALAGDVFALLSPWRAAACGIAWALGRTRLGRPRAPWRYPERLGRWPAAVGVLVVGWFELVYVDRDQPSRLAVLALAYAFLQFAGMGAFGITAWTSRADVFGVVLNMYSRLSPLDWRDREIRLRPPLSGLTSLTPVRGTVGLCCAMITTTMLDGALNGPLWLKPAPGLQHAFGHLGFGEVAAIELAGAIGLLVTFALVVGVFLTGARGIARLGGLAPGVAAARFAHTLVPIACGYLLAHYFSLVVYQSQALVALASDPLGQGRNLLGTANVQVNYTIVSAASIWYVQVAALLAGHVGGLMLAHDRALVLFGSGRVAMRSQYWMLAVMVGFTCIGLYLLSAVNV